MPMICKLEPKASVCISNKVRMQIFYIVLYETNMYKCLYLSTILKVRTVLAEKIEQTIYVNQQESFTDLQMLIK